MDVSLRKITRNDTDSIVNWRNKEFVRSMFLFRDLFTREIHMNWMKSKVETGEVMQYIIMAERKAVGSVFLKDIDKKNKKAEFGIFIGEENYLNKGVGTKATNLMLKVAKEELKLHKVYLRVISDNIRAIHSYEKSGFVVEAKLLDELLLEGEYIDIVLMGKIFEGD